MAIWLARAPLSTARNHFLVQLFIQRPTAWTPRMRADATEFVIEAVQILAQKPHYLQAKLVMTIQKIQEVLALDEGCGRLLHGLCGHPICVP